MSATSCPGALEFAAATIARLAPGAPLGVWLSRADAFLFPVGVAIAIVAIRQWTTSWVATAAVGLAIAAGSTPSLTHSPLDPLALIVAATTALALSPGTRLLPVIAGFVGTALIAPAAAISLAILVGCYAYAARPVTLSGSGWRLPFLAASSVALLSALVVLAVPPLPPHVPPTPSLACIVAIPTAASLREWLHGWDVVLSSLGMYALGLAALGAFSIAARSKSRTDTVAASTLLAFAILPALAAAGEPVVRSFSAAFVVFWICAGAGMSEIVRTCGRTAGGLSAATLLVALLPILQWSTGRAIATSAIERSPAGQLSARDVRQLLTVLPDNSVIVDEDAVTAALLRAQNDSWGRMGKQVRLAARDYEVLSALVADPGVHVFALPGSQPDLGWLGFGQNDADLSGIEGVTHVSNGGRCQRATEHWTASEFSTSSLSTMLSFVTRDFGQPHAVLVYAVSDALPHPDVRALSSIVRTGFQADTYTLSNPADRAALAGLVREDQMPDDYTRRLQPVVVRMEVWRAAGVPAVLPVEFGIPFTAVVVRATVPMADDLVCRPIPVEPRELRIRARS